MSRIISTIIIFILLVCITVTGYGFTFRCYQEFSTLYIQADKAITKSDQQKATEYVLEMIRLIENKKSGLMMINDHDTVELLLSKLNRAKKMLKLNEKTLASADLSDAKDIMNAIYGCQKADAENIF